MTLPLIKSVDLFLNNKPSVFALRETAKKALQKTGFPTLKTETWKYTNITPILQSNFDINTEESSCGHDCCCHEREATSDFPFIEIRFCRGKLHVEEYNTPKGLSVTPLPLALYEDDYKRYLFNSFDLEKHPFAALNGIYLEQGICITVEKNTKITSPVLIKYNQNHCENLQTHLHNLIVMEKGSQLDLIEEIVSDDGFSHLTNIVNELYLKADARLNHYKIQKESSCAHHLSLNAVKTQTNSSYMQFYFSNGAKISRQETFINLEQQGAKAEIYSAYKVKKDCLSDITTNINHLIKETFSNQYAKAVLQEKSAATFQGKIHIAPYAVKTAGTQLHKALYLNNDAQLNCKPELEIYADDVKCSHGASCGEIDKEQLFYLNSRGINQEKAKQMLINAHLEEIFSFIPNEKIKNYFLSKNIFS